MLENSYKRMTIEAIKTGVDAEAAIPMPPVGALFGLGLAELTAVMAALGQKPYRARQVFDALYKQRVASLDEVTTLPVALRDELRAVRQPAADFRDRCDAPVPDGGPMG